LVVVVGEEPGSGDEKQGDEEEPVSAAGELLPGGGFKIIQGGEGYSGEQAVEPGPGGVIDEAVVAFSEGGLTGQDVVPDEAADSQTGEEEAGQEPEPIFTRFANDEEQRKNKIELFFDAE
jgi:hypothetical protein